MLYRKVETEKQHFWKEALIEIEENHWFNSKKRRTVLKRKKELKSYRAF